MEIDTNYFIYDKTYPSSISLNDLKAFKEIAVKGRRIKFHLKIEGTNPLSHVELTYIKALPEKAINWGNKVFVDNDIINPLF